MINDILYENFGEKKKRTALVDGDNILTYSGLCRLIDSLSVYLSKEGIRKGDRICLYLPNSAEFVAAFFAITKIGAVCVPVNTGNKISELSRYISNSDSGYILTSEGLSQSTAKLKQDINTLVIKGDGAGRNFSFSEMTANGDSECVSDDDKAIMLFSTGSTGIPKCVARSHFNLLTLAENHTATVGWDSSDRILFVIPVSHTYAFGNLISALKVGAAVYMLEGFNRKRIVETVLKNKITIFPAVPFMLDVLSKHKGAVGSDFSSLKHVISAGAPMSESVAKDFYNIYGTYPRQLYGSSETGVISINLATDIKNRLSSVGRPVKNVEVKIVDEENNQLGINQMGEIIVKSPSMTSMYENLPEESVEAFRGGYYYTGDLGVIDSDGYIYIMGRKKLFINISGQKVDPVEVENVILLNDSVAEVVVLGREKSEGTEYVEAYIVLKNLLKASDIINFCRDKISEIKIPTSIKFVEEIPKSPMGKVLRDKLN